MANYNMPLRPPGQPPADNRPYAPAGAAPNRNQGNGWLDSTKRADAATFGGNSGRGVNDSGLDANGNPVVSSAAEAAQAYHQQGQDMANRQAYQLNYGQANGSFDAANADRSNAGDARNSQEDALALQKQAAEGTAPSRAEILGRGLIDQGLQSQLAAGASAGGGALGQAAATRQAQQGAAAYTQQGTQGLAAMRADETANARNAYMQGASGIRGQDYQGAGQATDMARAQSDNARAQGQLEFGQRQLNQQGQMGYDQMGYNTQNDQANRNVQEDKINSDNWQNQTQTNQHRTDANTNILTSAIGAVGSGLSGLVHLSDEDAKIPVFATNDSGAVDIGGKGGVSSADILKASAGSRDAMNTIGGGGLVGGAMPASTMGPTGGGDMAGGVGKAFGSFGKNAHLDTSDERAKSLTYGSKTEKGVAGAPKGYAADRARAHGLQYSGTSWGDTAQQDADRGVAPGTTDFEKSTPKKEKPLLLDGVAGKVGGAFDSFGRNANITYSDENAKKAAFDAGHEAGKAGIGDRAKAAIWQQVSGDPGEKHAPSDRMEGYANKVLHTGLVGLMSGTPVGGAAALGLIPASNYPRYDALKRTEEEAKTPAAPAQAPAPPPAEKPKQPQGVSDGAERLQRMQMYSDEEAKNEPKAPKMDTKGGRDPQTFHRDTLADQARTKRAYEDKAGSDAADLMASFGHSLEQGPSARRLTSGSKETGYETELTSGSEKAFRNKFGFPETKEERYLGNQSSPAYDLRGAYASGGLDGKQFTKTEDGLQFHDRLPASFSKPRSRQEAEREMGPPPGDPERERNPNAGPYQDPDGPGDEGVGDWRYRTYDDDNTQARRGGEMHQFKAEKGAFPDHIQEDANRRMVGFPYAYKDGYRPPEQGPGELNYGFSAQQLEKNPITATAVKKDPNGMRQVDVHKLVKAQGSSIASLQDQIDQMKGGRRG